MPFLSDFDIMEPEATLFTLGVTVQGVALVALLLQFQWHQHRRISAWKLDRPWVWLNTLSTLPGLVTTLSCVALGWAPWNTYVDLHRDLAYGIFVGGVLWGAVTCLLTWRFSKIDPNFRSFCGCE